MIGLLFTILVLGVVLYVIEHHVPLDPPFRIAIRVLGIVILIWMALRFVGLALPPPRLP